MRVVLDASALLAALQDEAGRDRVDELIDGASICAANLSEVAERFAMNGSSRDSIDALLRPLPIEVVSVDAKLALDAAMLKPLTRDGGLSLGDRLCIALALRQKAVALTADRSWATIADAVGVRVEVIR